MADLLGACGYKSHMPEVACREWAHYRVFEMLTGYTFLVCKTHYEGLEKLLEERTGPLTWIVATMDSRMIKLIKGQPPLSNRGVIKTTEVTKNDDTDT